MLDHSFHNRRPQQPALHRRGLRSVARIAEDDAPRDYPTPDNCRNPESFTAEVAKNGTRYDRDSRRVVVNLTNGCTFIFPADRGQGLVGASDEELAQVEALPGGVGLHWEKLDIDMSVPRLVAGIFGNQMGMRELGRRGGQATSPVKAAAVRENGKKGGRPRKISHA